MTQTSIEKSQVELTTLGERLRKHDAEATKLDRELATAIDRARAARMTVAEIAEHVGITPPTLYSIQRRAKTQTEKTRPGTSRHKS